MDQISLPIRVLLLATLAFAALWFTALKPKPPGGASEPAQPAAAAKPEKTSALPGPLGDSVDKARTARTQGDAAAARSERADATPAPAAKPATTPAAKPAPTAAKPSTTPVAKAPRKAKPEPARREPAGASPRKVRRALARGHAVVLLFYSARASDDRAVRSELAGISRRGGRVEAWGVSVRGLSRFKNVLRGVQVLQSPTVVVLSPRGQPVQLAGYTDGAEIDQVTAAALRKRR